MAKCEYWTRLSNARHRARMTQGDLAKRAGITTAWVSHFERGRRLPSLKVFRQIVLALGVTADELLGINPGTRKAFNRQVGKEDGKAGEG